MVLQLRRVIILALVSGTPKSNPSLDRVLQTVYLSEVKGWLEDLLNGSVGKSGCATRWTEVFCILRTNCAWIGGVDLLLHLLKNIADLPVTTSMVKQSGLGKLVGSIEKHRVCSGPNEGNIRENIFLVKSSWKASVKARKIAEGSSQPKLSVVPKRDVPSSNEPASPSAKRAKVAESSPKSSLSSLLNRMSGSNSSSSQSSPANKTKAQTTGIKVESAKKAWKDSTTSRKCNAKSQHEPSSLPSRSLHHQHLLQVQQRRKSKVRGSNGQTILEATWKTPN